jgi:hypothetical protein
MKSGLNRRMRPREDADMTVATRYCLQDPVRGSIRLPQGNFNRHAFGDEATPESAGKEIMVAVAEVELDAQKIVAIRRVRPVVWRFGADGQLDRPDRAVAIGKKMRGEAVDEVAFSEVDMKAFRREFRMNWQAESRYASIRAMV